MIADCAYKQLSVNCLSFATLLGCYSFVIFFLAAVENIRKEKAVLINCVGLSGLVIVFDLNVLEISE